MYPRICLSLFYFDWMYPIIEHQSTLHTQPYVVTPSLCGFSLLVWGPWWLLAALCVNSVWEWPHTVGDDVSILCPLTHHIPTRLISLPYTDRHVMHLFYQKNITSNKSMFTCFWTSLPCSTSARLSSKLVVSLGIGSRSRLLTSVILCVFSRNRSLYLLR